MKIDDSIRLNHALDSIAEIEIYIEGINFDNFINNSLIAHATINQLIIIGEATKNLSDNLILENKEVY